MQTDGIWTVTLPCIQEVNDWWEGNGANSRLDRAVDLLEVVILIKFEKDLTCLWGVRARQVVAT